MKIFSAAFHTSYQYNLATAFPEHHWTFAGGWADNRPIPGNVSLDHILDLNEYDFFLAHSPTDYVLMAGRLDEAGIRRSRIIYITHWGRQPDEWIHAYGDVDFYDFLRDVSFSPIVCVSHYMRSQFEFYSDVIVEVIPHFIPEELFNDPVWSDNVEGPYINVVNGFYAPKRGVGADFWDSLPIDKRLYGDGNRPTDGGRLNTVEAFKQAAAQARAYLWTADAVATSFAPLEAMALGCPLIAPDNLDWRIEFEDSREVLLYRPGDRASCMAQIARFESQPALRRTLSERGREAVFDRFRKAWFRERWERVFDAALASDALSRTRGALSLRRGSGTLEREPGAYDLITEIKASRSLYAVHPTGVDESIKQELRNRSNSVDLMTGLQASASAELHAHRRLFVAARDYGATVQAVMDPRWETLVAAPVDILPYARKSLDCARSLGVDAVPAETGFTDIAHISAERIDWDRPEEVASFVSQPDTLAVINLSGLEPAVLNSLFDQDALPKSIIMNCQPHVSWSLGCHVELLLQRLEALGYAVAFRSIPALDDLSEAIAPEDNLPKLHRYILTARR